MAGDAQPGADNSHRAQRDTRIMRLHLGLLKRFRRRAGTLHMPSVALWSAAYCASTILILILGIHLGATAAQHAVSFFPTVFLPLAFGDRVTFMLLALGLLFRFAMAVKAYAVLSRLTESEAKAKQ